MDPAPASHAQAEPDRVNAELRTALPRSFGGYELLALLGHGGMGIVYQARQAGLNRIVAVKMLPFDPFTREDFVRRFRAEAEAVARLQHPNIVAIFDVGEIDGQHFFSMEYVAGSSLAEAIREKPLPPARAVRLLHTIAGAVHYAHERGILHRDLKPSNILLDAVDEPHISDFGLAKNLEGNSDLTLSGQALGSPSYIPPEQAEGRSATTTRACDVYSLGAVLYHVLTGRPPFVSDTVAATLHQVIHENPVAPRVLNSGIARDLETICLKCLEKDPARRYRSARELADELERFQRGEPIRARPISWTGQAWRWCRRRPALAGLSAGLAVTIAAGLIASVVLWQREQKRAEEATAHLLRVELERAEDMFEGGDAPEALARLARLHRAQPENLVVAQRIVSALTHRNFIAPASEEIEDVHEGRILTLAIAGDRLVTATNGGRAVTVWNTARGLERELEIPLPAPARVTALSHDAQRLAVVMQDRTLQVWRMPPTVGSSLATTAARASASPTEAQDPTLQTTTALTTLPTALHFDPTGARVLALSEPTGVEIIDAVSGTSLLAIADAHFAEFSPDGRRLVTVVDAEATLRDAATLQPIGAPIRHRFRILTARLSPDSTRLLTASADLTASIWEVATGARIGLPFSHTEQLQDAIFSPDGQRIVTEGLSAQAQVWDAMARVPMGARFPQWRQFFPALFSPDGFWFLSHYRDRLWIRDAFDGRAVSEPLRFAGHISGARFLADGRRFVTSGQNNRARLWSVLPGDAAPLAFRQDNDLLGAAFTPDGERVLTIGRGNVAQLWSAASGQPLGPELRHARRLTCGSFSPSGKLVATGDFSGGLKVWDAFSSALLAEPARYRTDITTVAFSPDERWLIASSSDGDVRVYDAHTGTLRWEARHAGAVRAFAISLDGHTLASAGDDRVVRVWSLADGTVTTSFEHAAGVSCLAFSPDENTLAAGDQSGSVRFWDLRVQREAGQPLQHGAAVLSLDFSRDGRRLVTASADQTARIWDVGTRETTAPPLTHRGIVGVASFSPDERHVLTGSNDNTARVWDAFTGQPVSDALKHGNWVVSAQWAPDGRSVLTASWDGSARRWAMPLLRESPPSGVLADLAETFGGLRLAENDVPQRVTAERAAALEKIRAAAVATDMEMQGWCEWLLADRASRTIAPGIGLRAEDYVSSRLVDIRPDRIRELLRWTPMNATGLARWSLLVLEQNPERNRRISGEALFVAELAVKIDESCFVAWWSLAAAREFAGDIAGAREAFARARALQPETIAPDDARKFAELERRVMGNGM